MARPAKNRSARPQLTAGQAAYVLDRLISDRRVSRTDLDRYVSDMGREIGELERRLESLRAAHGGAQAGGGTRTRAPRGRKAASAPAAAPAKKAGRKKSRRISAEQRASQKIQGRYLGLVRQFPASKRPYFAKVAKEKGREAAIKEMLDLKK